MSIWKKLTKRKRPAEEVRDALALEVLDLQMVLIRLLFPSALNDHRETNFLASVALCAIILTTPGKSQKEKEKDYRANMDVLIRAVDVNVENDSPEAQKNFSDELYHCITAYLSPTSLLLGKPDEYSALEKHLSERLTERMGYRYTAMELLELEIRIQSTILGSAHRLWPILKD